MSKKTIIKIIISLLILVWLISLGYFLTKHSEKIDQEKQYTSEPTITIFSNTWIVDMNSWYELEFKATDATSVKVNSQDVIGSWDTYKIHMNLLLNWNIITIAAKNNYKTKRAIFSLQTLQEVQEQEKIKKEQKLILNLN